MHSVSYTHLDVYKRHTRESANLAAGLRRIDFYFDPREFWGPNATNGMRLFLTEEFNGYVTGVYIDGVPVQKYFDTSGTQLVYSYAAQYVDLSLIHI